MLPSRLKEFDPMFNTHLAPLSEPLVSSVTLDVDEALFTEIEVTMAIRFPSSKSARAPEYTSVNEPIKIPPNVFSHIFHNWLAFGLVPLEMKQSRTVFLPTKPNPEGPSDSLFLQFRLFTRLLLCRLSATNHFQKFRSGFADDCSTSSPLLNLQTNMRTLKRKHRHFLALV